MKEILVDVLYVEGCNSTNNTIEFIQSTASELGISVKIHTTTIRTKDEAREKKFYGSPTVQIAGQDIDPGARLSENYGLG